LAEKKGKRSGRVMGGSSARVMATQKDRLLGGEMVLRTVELKKGGKLEVEMG
jgi:hypothetical protein